MLPFDTPMRAAPNFVNEPVWARVLDARPNCNRVVAKVDLHRSCVERLWPEAWSELQSKITAEPGLPTIGQKGVTVER
jgi:hypothetical protein